MRPLSQWRWLLALHAVFAAGLVMARDSPTSDSLRAPPTDEVFDPATAVMISDQQAPGLKRVPAVDESQTAQEDKKEKSKGFDQALVTAGSAAFSSSCTQCHDAERSLGKRKDIAAWRATVRRMAGKTGADIPSSEWESIATYLASQSSAASGTSGAETDSAKAAAEGAPEPQFSAFATVSPLWRGGSHQLENPGFFPEAWVGAAWQPKDNPLSAKVTSCITCHSEPGAGNRIEIVEASLRLDVAQWLGFCNRDVRTNVEAGRLLVPFGAFASQTNPGVYRTVTKPLIYDMGQNVYRTSIGNPVLPMPYADEGILGSAGLPVAADCNATLDVYAVNGLQGNIAGVDFLQSRDYVDNNFDPALGGRITLGDRTIRVGSSLTSGRFSNESGGTPRMNYWLFGFDLVARHEDVWRLQAEYARRESDRVLFLPGQPLITEHVEGFYVEGELRVLCEPKISLLARYDVQQRGSAAPPIGSTLPTGSFAVDRFTWGFNVYFKRGSVLMINHERWFLPAGLTNVDVVGMRWTATF